MNRSTSTRISILVLILFATVLPAFAQTTPSPDSSMAYLKVLSDPNTFAGRKTGTPSGHAAQEWIAQQYQRWGLKPLVKDNLLVPFSMLASNEVRADITLDDPRYGETKLRLGEDFTACTNSGSATLTAPVSLVGHGISKPDKGWDDYGDADVAGRIVIIFRGNPTAKQDWGTENQRSYLLTEAIRRGAVAVFFHQEEWPVNGAAINSDAYSETVPSGYIGDSALRMLLFNSGESLEGYEDQLKKAPYVLTLDRQMTIDFLVERIPDAIGYDVAGVVPGTDPKLAKEAVVVGGHADHVGPNALGQVYPGADDNGSGTSTVMELARYYAAHPQKRTLVFCNFGGEEQGLLGSRALVPLLPKDYTYVTMLNLDMVGRGEGLTGFGGGDQTAEIWNPWFAALPDSIKSLYRAGRAWGGEASDHAPFRNSGIPAYTIWSFGAHSFYHRPDDSFETIQKKAMAGALTTTSTWIDKIANVDQPLLDLHLPQRVVWHQGSPFVRVNASSSLSDDLSAAKQRAASGIMGTVLEFPYSADQGVFLAQLESFRKAVNMNPSLLSGEHLRNVLNNSRQAKETVIAAVNGDELQPADSVRILEWADAGLGMICIDDMPEWLEGDSLSSDQEATVNALKSGDLRVLTTFESWDEARALFAAIGAQTYFTASYKHFDKASDDQLEAIRATGAKLIVFLKKSEMKKAAKQTDRFARFRIHVQPADDGYEDALEWVAEAQKRGLEDEQVVDWLSDNMRYW